MQVEEAAQLRRYPTAQLVKAQVQPIKVGEAAQLRRYLTAQLIPRKVQRLQVGEAAQFRRYLTTQLVLKEVQPYHAPAGVSGYAVPSLKGELAQPVPVLPPVRSPGGFVEYRQGLAILRQIFDRRISLGLSSPQARCRSWTWYNTCPKAVQEYRL